MAKAQPVVESVEPTVLPVVDATEVVDLTSVAPEVTVDAPAQVSVNVEGVKSGTEYIMHNGTVVTNY